MSELTGPQWAVIIYGALAVLSAFILHGRPKKGQWNGVEIILGQFVVQWFFWYIGVWS